MKLLGAHRFHTTAYHPMSNGMIERFHWILMNTIWTPENVANWYKELQRTYYKMIVRFAYRTTVKENLKNIPSELLYDESIRGPAESFVSSETWSFGSV